jgi:hypothetical protein
MDVKELPMRDRPHLLGHADVAVAFRRWRLAG